MTHRVVFFDQQGVLRSGWAAALFVAVVAVCGVTAMMIIRPSSMEGSAALVFMLVRLASALLATWLGCLVVGAPFGSAGFSDTRKGQRFWIGLLIALVLLLLTVGVPWLIGALGLSWATDGPQALVRSGIVQLAILVPGSISEEIVFRGFFFQQIRRGLGTIVAVSGTSVLFGVVHLWNPNAHWIEAVIIALAGVWFGLLVLKTGSLWLSSGLHVGWNFIEGFVFGQPVSGFTISVPLIRRTYVGPVAWTGGAFGPEGSLWLAVLVMIAIIGSLWYFRSVQHRPGTITSPEEASTVEVVQL